MNDVKVIAEIGINANGNVRVAEAIAAAAKHAGFDFVKLQKRDPDWCYSPEELVKPCESPWGATVSDKVRGRELSWDEIEEFNKYCTILGIRWSCSCFDLKSLQELHDFYPDRPWNKVPSAMALQPAFVLATAKQKKLTLISTALLDDDALERVARVFESCRCPYILNHCVGLYPAPPERLNLRAIRTLAQKYHTWSNCVGVGYSGHETGVLPSVLAVQLGATWIERHVTLDRSAYGADQAASLEPHGMELLIRDIRSVEKVSGDGIRRLHGDEKNPVTYWRER